MLRQLGGSRKVAEAIAWASMFRCGTCSGWARPNKDPDWQNLQRRQDGGLDHIDCLFTASVRKTAQRDLDRYQRSAARIAVFRDGRLA
jgi:hypothetical protein